MSKQHLKRTTFNSQNDQKAKKNILFKFHIRLNKNIYERLAKPVMVIQQYHKLCLYFSLWGRQLLLFRSNILQPILYAVQSNATGEQCNFTKKKYQIKNVLNFLLKKRTKKGIQKLFNVR